MEWKKLNDSLKIELFEYDPESIGEKWWILRGIASESGNEIIIRIDDDTMSKFRGYKKRD